MNAAFSDPHRTLSLTAQRVATAVALACVAGYVNACILLIAGVMVSHVTGAFTHAATDITRVGGYPALQGALAFGGVVVMFLAGAMVSAFLTGSGRRTARLRHGRRTARTLSLHHPGRFRTALLLEALLLAIAGATSVEVMIAGEATLAWYACLYTAAAAMGVQNATLTRVSGTVVRTTHLTGMTTDLGIALADLVLDRRADRAAMKALDPVLRRRRLRVRMWRSASARRARLFVGVMGSFALGAVAGSAAFALIPLYALWPATMGLVIAALVSSRSPEVVHAARLPA